MSDETVKIEVNGRELEARKGEMLIRVTDREGILVPRFCYHEKLSIAANCRMCLVEVEKAPKPMPACATPVTEGMKVNTRSAKALAAQKAVMEFLLINHPLDCPICDQGGECELQDLAIGYGSGVSQYTERKRVVADKNIGPLISTDMTRCIHCTRCVRFGDEIAGVMELGATGRTENMRIGTYIENSVDHEMSGNVIDICPVGALNSKPFRFRARGWEMTQIDAVGVHDGLGSSLFAHELRGRLMRVVPRRDESINETWISDMDRFSYEGVYAADRLARPLVKRDGEWVETDWQTALEAAVDRLTKATGGDWDRLGVLASPSATTEEHYLLAKLARGLGTPHLDHRLRQHDFRDAGADPAYPSLGQGIDEFERNDALLVIGANLRKDAPILAHRLRKAALRGAKVAFVDSRRFEYFFPVSARRITRPSAQVDELSAIANAAFELSGAAVPASLKQAMKSARAGEEHRAIASALADAAKSTVMLGRLAHAHPRYADLRALAAAIAGQTGATLAFLPQGGNAAGAALAGMLPHRESGGRAAARTGLDARAMFESPRDAWLLHNLEPEHDALDGNAALAALGQSKAVVVLNPYVTDAIRSYASVILPVGTFAETAGTLVNAAGTWLRWKAFARPYADSRPAWRVLRVLGNLFDVNGFDHEHIGEVRDELDRMAGDTDSPPFTTAHEVSPGGAAGGIEPVTGFACYGGDPVLRRAIALQRTRDAQEDELLRVHPETGSGLGLADGIRVRAGMAEFTVAYDDGMAVGAVWVPHGTTATAGVSSGELTLEVVTA